MHIRRFRGKTVHAALDKAKHELGPDAVLMYTKTLKGPRTGGETVEIIVGVDKEAPSTLDYRGAPQKEALEQVLRRANSALAGNAYHKSQQQPATPAQEDIDDGEDDQISLPKSVALNRSNGPQSTMAYVGSELSEIREILHILLQNDRSQQAAELHENVQGLHRTFLENEVEASLAYDLAKGMEVCFEEEDLSVHQHLATLVGKTVKTCSGIRLRQKPTQIALVGPTGVGKTTTLAKLAAHYHLKEEKQVVLLTIDNYRIAATQQLRTYSEILSLPFEVAQTPEELEQKVQMHQDADLILIDTPGRSQLDMLHLREIEAFLNSVRPDETHLLISASTRNRDVRSILKHYGAIGVNRLTFTKLDETHCFGTILNASMHSDKPISYLTTGQDVATDIEVPDSARIASFLLRGFRK